MFKTITKLATKRQSKQLSDFQNLRFEDELIDMNFPNVGTYHRGSRTKMSK